MAVVVLVGIGLLVRESLTYDAGDADPSSLAYRVGYSAGWLADISPNDNVYAQLPRSEWAVTADERIDDAIKALADDCDSHSESDLSYIAGRELALQDRAAGMREKSVFEEPAEGGPTGLVGNDCD